MYPYRNLAVMAALLIAAPAAAQNASPVAADFLAIWDTDGDGQVTADEAEARRAEVFAAFDGNGDGALDAAEYAVFDEDLAAEFGSARGDAENAEDAAIRETLVQAMALSEADEDGDGQVSRAEFSRRNGNWFAKLDRDNDGALTLSDFVGN